MSSPTKNHIPQTVAEWETVLVERFLRIGPDGDASPIKSFEVTGDSIGEIFEEDPLEVEKSFRKALRSDNQMWRALRTGSHRISTDKVPNYFAYLAMSLLIDTLLDGDYSAQGQYRDRLRAWLQTSRSMMELSGLATMWRELGPWLDSRRALGEPYRRLLLPEPPKSWTQIGYTRRLSFPTRSDTRFLRRIISSYKRGISDVPGLIRFTESEIAQGGASWGLEAAFREFKDAFRVGHASTDHRFWRLVLRSLPSNKVDTTPEAILELSVDEDGARILLLGSGSDRTSLSITPTIATAMQSKCVLDSSNLSSAAKSGILFFKRAGIARWIAQPNLPLGASEIHLAFSPNIAHRAKGAILTLVESGSWFLTKEPVSSKTIDDVLSRTQLTTLKSHQLLEITLTDGIRISTSWLGRKAFLPRLDAGRRHIRIDRLASESAEVHANENRLSASRTVDGLYILAATAGTDDDAQSWVRRVRFVSNAIPHSDLNGANYKEPLLKEWVTNSETVDAVTLPDALDWSDAQSDYTDLLEAIYAAGRSGLSEPELLDLVQRSGIQNVNPWTLLRSIQEATFIEARYRRRWRGRIWTLGRPHLIEVPSDGPKLIVVEGALCASLEDEFRDVASRNGGKPFRRYEGSLWSAPTIGALGIDPQIIGDVLGWPVKHYTAPNLQTPALEASSLAAENHVLTSSWDWGRQRFVVGSLPNSKVSLTRWTHPGGRDHDVYRVKSERYSSTHMTRVSAIIRAHSVAGRPLFEASNGFLRLTSNEGALPLEIARWLRLRTLASSGVHEDGGYKYPLGNVSPVRLTKALPGCIHIPSSGNEPRSRTDIHMIARRSGGKMRARWHGVTMAATNDK